MTGAVRERLALLEGTGLIQLASIDPELEYLFRHVLVQEAAYQSLLKQERRELHARVGEVIERLYPGRAEEHAGVLAMHFEQADDAERALPYLMSAGEQARRRYANREAHAFFSRALQLVPTGDSSEERRQRATIGLRMQQAGVGFVPTDEALQQLATVRTEAQAAGDERILGEALLLSVLSLIWRGDQVETSAELASALDQAQEIGARLGDPALRAIPRAFIARSRITAGRLREAIELLTEAIPDMQAVGRLREASLFAGELAFAHARLGEFGSADDWVRRSLKLADDSGDPDARLDADLMFSHIEALRGNVDEAIRFAQQAVEQADRVDNKGCGLVGRFIIGEQLLRLGQPADAISPLLQGSGMAAFCVLSPSIIARGQALLASAHLKSGQAATNLQAFDSAVEAARAVGDVIAEGVVLRERALARAEAGDQWPAVEADFAASTAIFERIGARPYLARSLFDQGRTAVQHEVAAGRELMERAAQLFDEMGVPEQARRIRDSAAA
jgi:tetratricopeptide (TPR) repeat protein